MKFLKVIIRKIPAYGPFLALQRFTIFSESLYPQYLTWDRVTWKSKPTPRKKLVPWYLFSLLNLTVSFNFLYVAFREVIAHDKDPDINITEAIILIFYICSNLTATMSIINYVFRAKEICFVMNNLQKLKLLVEDDGT